MRLVRLFRSPAILLAVLLVGCQTQSAVESVPDEAQTMMANLRQERQNAVMTPIEEGKSVFVQFTETGDEALALEELTEIDGQTFELVQLFALRDDEDKLIGYHVVYVEKGQ